MKRSVTAFGALAIACTVAGRDTPPDAPEPQESEPVECVCECDARDDDKLERCESNLAETAESLDEARGTVRTRTRVVTAVVPARKCGGEPPKIEHVATAPCAGGMMCLDARAQRALTLNLAAYEAYVRKVQACESEPSSK